MNKHILALILISAFCVNISLHCDNTTKESTIDSVLQDIFNQSFNKRASLIDPKTNAQTLSQISHSPETASEEPKDADHIELTRQKLGFDPKPLLAATISVACVAAALFFTRTDNKVASACSCFGAFLFACITYDIMKRNSNQSFGQSLTQHPTQKARIILIKQADGTWDAQYQKSRSTSWTELYINMSDPKPLKIDKQKIEQLAKEIIANHDANVKQEDLYSSQIFKDLAATQK